MSIGHFIQSIIEFIVIIGIIFGLIFEDRLAKWEAKICRMIIRNVRNAAKTDK